MRASEQVSTICSRLEKSLKVLILKILLGLKDLYGHIIFKTEKTYLRLRFQSYSLFLEFPSRFTFPTLSFAFVIIIGKGRGGGGDYLPLQKVKVFGSELMTLC